jgi:hypothetical protein
VLVVGGRSGTKGHVMGRSPMGPLPMHDPHAVLEPELFHPDKEEWSPMATMQVDRLYHSNAVLLPSGHVMTAGSNPDRGVHELRIEIYAPPYMFKGQRPVIQHAPAEVTWGQDFEVTSGDAPNIDEVVLVRPSATTHCVNTEQRLIELQITQRASARVTVSIPRNQNVAPPGFYMLFVLASGIPSAAVFVRVG